MPKFPVVKLEVPGTLKMPDSVIAPPALIVKFCPRVDAANCNAPLVVRAASKAPLLFKVTAPLKLFACVKLMAFAPALKLEVPPTVKAPVWPMPAPVAVRFVPMLEAAKFKVLAFVIVAEVPLVRATAPTKLLLPPFVVKSIEVPAFKVVVPGTVIAAD